MSSRFFTASSSSLGTVLAPNSSPLSGEDDFTSIPTSANYIPKTSDVASSSRSMVANSSVRTTPAFGYDPLTAPTNFLSRHGSSSSNSLRRNRDYDSNSRPDDEPPRKRVNMGTGTPVRDIAPESPELLRVGQHHRTHRTSVDEMSTSSDDYLPDLSSNVASTSTRLRRTRKSPAIEVRMTNEQPDQRFIAFKMTHPMEPPSRTLAAWNQAGGDVNKATALMADSSWSPQTSPSVDKEGSGRVKEIDEASKALREATKAKGKLSMIYANRSNLEAQQLTPVASHASQRILTSPLSPTTPIAKPSRTKTKKLVIQSESEDDDSSIDGSMPVIVENVHEMKALDYFNKSDGDALRELTGMPFFDNT